MVDFCDDFLSPSSNYRQSFISMPSVRVAFSVVYMYLDSREREVFFTISVRKSREADHYQRNGIRGSSLSRLNERSLTAISLRLLLRGRKLWLTRGWRSCGTCLIARIVAVKRKYTGGGEPGGRLWLPVQETTWSPRPRYRHQERN